MLYSLQRADFLAANLHLRLGGERGFDRGGKPAPVHRQRAARRNPVGVGRAQYQGIAAPHLLMQQTDGVVERVVGAQRVRAHQLGEAAGLVRLGAPRGAHFVKHDRHMRPRQLPRRLAAGEAATDDVDGQADGHAPPRARACSPRGTLPAAALAA